jgi:tRNA pseudouridine synthase 10
VQNAKHGNNSFRIRLAYTHSDSSQKLQLQRLLLHDNGRKRKAGLIILVPILLCTTLFICIRFDIHLMIFCHALTEMRNGKNNSTDDSDNHSISELDSFIYMILEGIQDQEFCKLIELPPDKVPTHHTDFLSK